MEKQEVFKKMQEELKNIREINAKNLEEKETDENYRDPLEITLNKEILISLSWGGPADGFKLKYRQDELIGGIYYWQDWGTYDESDLTIDEAREVEDFYLYGDPSAILNPNN